MPFDPATLLGPTGGIIAIAYGAGAASGYAFCLRTMYKILKSQAEKDENDCKEEIKELKQKLNEKDEECKLLNERLIHGMHRQQEQIERSGLYLLGKEDKLK